MVRILLPKNLRSAQAQALLRHLAVLMMAFVLTLLYHGMLGIQVVIEDYVEHRALELGLHVFVKLSAFLCALGTVFALIRITLGA